ncbi:MAG: transglycosylase SLT domain-containing protein [Hyphomicrobiales bacterium]|nr:transglycosylase SLT domain-containing protein [Hyphomicrobiales bacterium]
MRFLRGVTLTVPLAAGVLTIFIYKASSGVAAVSNQCEPYLVRAARQTGVPTPILYAVGLNETGRRGRLHPYALNIAGRGVFAKDKSHAIALVRSAQKRGVRLIDVGCMQINILYHRHQFASLEHMLEPAANTLYAARFLVRLNKAHGSWTLALARYHAGPKNNVAQKRYVCLAIRNMITVGMGKWTPAARRFCS